MTSKAKICVKCGHPISFKAGDQDIRVRFAKTWIVYYYICRHCKGKEVNKIALQICKDPNFTKKTFRLTRTLYLECKNPSLRSERQGHFYSNGTWS